MARTHNKPVVLIAPDVNEWDEDPSTLCEHGFREVIGNVIYFPALDCLQCAGAWENLSLWSELLDEA